AVEPFQLRGWAYDPDRPGPLEVEMLLDQTPIGRTVANIYRKDLQEAGYGSGECAFVFNFSEKQSDDVLLNISVRVKLLDGTFELLPRPVQSEHTNNATPAPTLAFNEYSIDDSQTPIFVLGAARSGTTAIAQALMKSGYKGFLEGHFLDLLAPLTVSL